MLTGIVAMAISSKRAYGDSFARRARGERMQLPAEMLRAFLPAPDPAQPAAHMD